MDQSLAVKSEDGDISWPDSRSHATNSPTVEFSAHSMPSTRSPQASTMAWVHPSTAQGLSNGQLSPVSPRMNLAHIEGGSAANNILHSASSTDSWSLGYDRDEDREAAAHWHQGTDGTGVLDGSNFKAEPKDEDDFVLTDIKEAAGDQQAAGDDQPRTKRPRGRPRKHPVAPPVTTGKVTKGRSKTGCITCRKRKKKCDEAKPRCNNCEKNAVVCEGYHEKQLWKSGKEKAEDERRRRESLPVITMQPLFHGIETAEDRIFWKHYCNKLSNVLTVEGEAKNAFKDIVLQLATRHQGLMHSILALSSKHIDYDTPYGSKILQENPSVTLETLERRSNYHHEESIKLFHADLDHCKAQPHPEKGGTMQAVYGQMLCLLLQTLAEGNPRGEHRVHLQAYKNTIRDHPPEDPLFLGFIVEFFQYHIYADELIWHPDSGHARLADEGWKPPIPLSQPRLMGVTDGLFVHLSQITTIRNAIRLNILTGAKSPVNYQSLFKAQEIEESIKGLVPRWPDGDAREKVGMLYKQMIWIYLFSTVHPPPIEDDYMSQLQGKPRCSETLPDMTTPPGSASSMHTGNVGSSMTGSFSRTNSFHGDLPALPHPSPNSRSISPPPIQVPALQDPRISTAVEECLQLIECFQTSDAAQTLLLIPSLVIGPSCFDPAQQERVRAAVHTVKGYTGLKNCDCVMILLEEVWRLMKRGKWLAVWDWQGVAHGLSLDFLCT